VKESRTGVVGNAVPGETAAVAVSGHPMAELTTSPASATVLPTNWRRDSASPSQISLEFCPCLAIRISLLSYGRVPHPALHYPDASEYCDDPHLSLPRNIVVIEGIRTAATSRSRFQAATTNSKYGSTWHRIAWMPGERTIVLV
jgi:hypothetical protein